MNKPDTKTGSNTWQSLYRLGGAAPMITLAIYISQFLVIVFSGVTYPGTPEGWFALFQRNTLLGFIFLNAFDGFSIAILGLIFLALYIALRESNPTSMIVAAFFAFLGIAVFVSSRTLMVSGALNLSHQYAMETTDLEKFQLYTAWLAITSPTRATPETTGFLFIAIGSLVISTVMNKSEYFGKPLAYIGFFGGIITVVNAVSVAIAPSIAAILMPINGAIWLIWWLLVSQKLFRLAKRFTMIDKGVIS